MIRTLADILAPEGESHFLRHFSEKKRFHLASDSHGRAESLFPWSEIDRLIYACALTDRVFKVMLNRNRVEPKIYRDKETGALKPDLLLALASQGATFVIDKIQTQIPTVDALAAAIERRLGVNVWVNTYLSFGKFSGFLTHSDAHDVLILQVWGSKRWRTYGTAQPYPLRGSQSREPDTFEWEGVLRSGDVLYIPRGELHAAVPVASPSVHLTIGLRAGRGVDVLNWLAERGEHEVRLRTDLERHSDPIRAADQETRIKRVLHDLIDGIPLSEYFTDTDHARPSRNVTAFHASGRLRPSTVLVTALRRRLDLEIANDAEIEMTIGGRPVRLSAGARRMLQAITDRGRMTVAALAAAMSCQPDDHALTGFIDELSRKAMLAIEDEQ